MKLKNILPLLFIITLSSCINERDSGNLPEKKPISINEDNAEQGALYVKFKAAAMDKMSIETRGGVVTTNIPQLDELTRHIGASKMERVFRPGGKFEERHRKAGLHLWYRINFDESMSVTRAANDLYGMDFVDKVNPVYKISLPANSTAILAETVADHTGFGTRAQHASGFNDPNLPKQWHYYNDGSLDGAIAGADINLVKAWEINTGDPDVIVCIVDGGIDIDHADLEANIWINDAEANGIPGVDDDDNGYVDDIHGWNFAENSANLFGHYHGAHVAGTVAAVTNNGVGVAGIAGGNGVPDTGVKLISAHCSLGQNERSLVNALEALVYGADNGAVISQNSWGYPAGEGGEFFDIYKEAIDYFIENAGIDPESGIQTGPMKGGIVIFSAGNDYCDTPIVPASYERVFSIAGMAHNFKIAWYSSYGSWVTATAPGGDLSYGSVYGVLSTAPNNKYSYMNGTSMASPHASGIAALVISEVVKYTPRFTNRELWDILVSSVKDIDQYNPGHVRMLGRGYMDAFMALRAVQAEYGYPVLASGFDDLYFGQLGQETILEPGNHFENGGTYDYEVTASTPGLLEIIKLQQGAYKLTAKKYGISEVTVTAINSHGITTKDSFKVASHDDSQEIELYPNPVKDFLNIRMGGEANEGVTVTIYNSMGVNVLSKTVSVTTFTPGVIDARPLYAGNYTVKISYGSKTATKHITKL